MPETATQRTMIARHIACPECGAPMLLKPAGKFGPWYACSKWNVTGCKGAHGAHPNGAPKGFPGNAATRQARIRAHAAFDRLWRSGKMSRKAAYLELQKAMGMTKREAHIAKFTAEQCETMIQRFGEAKE